uniref:Uncharacterized protein n=1 Tax=Rhizophora mucronata TaxID=61149 RepID=A0A2P2MHP9_RHIMU
MLLAFVMLLLSLKTLLVFKMQSRHLRYKFLEGKFSLRRGDQTVALLLEVEGGEEAGVVIYQMVQGDDMVAAV